MYSKIVNPRTGRRVSVKSRLGKNILRNYLFILSGGAAPRVWSPKYTVSQTAQYNTAPPSGGGGSWVDVVIVDSPNTFTPMYLIQRSDDGTELFVDEDNLRPTPLSNSDRATRGLMMAMGTRVPDDPDDGTIFNMGSGSLSLREVVNSKQVMRNIFQYAKQTLDLTVCTATLTGHSSSVFCVAVLADGRFATGSADDTVKVWKETSPGVWSVEATLTGHRYGVLCVAVLADGRFVTGSDDKTVKVWKESSPGSGVWSVEATLTGHHSYVYCVAVLADGRLATGSIDKTVNVWGGLR